MELDVSIFRFDPESDNRCKLTKGRNVLVLCTEEEHVH